jgi:pimeloyl-ACP methyl ester carboxylesterase
MPEPEPGQAGRPDLGPVAHPVTIETDGVPLDGLYYPAAGAQDRGGVLLMHGNTMNFYVGAPRFLPPRLVPLGFACLAFNRRGHDILSTRDSRQPVGGAYQTAAQGMADNDCAAAALATLGHPEPVVVGHSNGGLLASQFAAAHPETRALVLLSPHMGGPDIVPRSCAVGHLAADRYEEVVTEARRLVAAGRGEELLLLPGWWYVLTAASFLDRLERTPSLLEAALRITAPCLLIKGAEEDPGIYPIEEFAARCAGPCEVVQLPDCDHFYRGREDEVAGIVSGWLDATLPAGRSREPGGARGAARS